MIAVIVLISVLVTLIACSVSVFTLLAKIEDDYREIGVMKAIGMRTSDIKGVYLTSYTVLAAFWEASWVYFCFFCYRDR